MPLKALQSCFMIPLCCMHYYLAFSCHVLLKAAMWAHVPQTRVLALAVLSSPWAIRSWNGLGWAEYGEEYTARQAAPTQQTAHVTTDPQPSLPPLHICGVREFPLPGMFLLQQMLWSWANTAVGHPCTPTYQTIMLELRELTYCSPNRQNSAFGQNSL